MEDYIRVYENVISSNWCDALIEKFEDFDDQHEVFDDKRLFIQINFGKNLLWKHELDYLERILLEQVKKYGNDVRLSNQWPSKYTLEPIRMKRYLPNQKDNFPSHVDVTGTDNNSRFLVMFLYLSDNEKGETIFPQHHFTSKCKQGNILIFPSLWPWLHSGNFPVDTPKYIVGSYLHYVD